MTKIVFKLFSMCGTLCLFINLFHVVHYLIPIRILNVEMKKTELHGNSMTHGSKRKGLGGKAGAWMYLLLQSSFHSFTRPTFIGQFTPPEQQCPVVLTQVKMATNKSCYLEFWSWAFLLWFGGGNFSKKHHFTTSPITDKAQFI